MKRLFSEHSIRKTMSLDGAWKIRFDRENEGKTLRFYEKEFTDEATVIVPSCWNTQFGMLEYTGNVWYQKKFYTDSGAKRLHFGAVMTYAEVWLDGNYLGFHYGGFCEFEFIIDSLCEGEHILTVRVDNSFDEKSIPQATVDWYHYGGITRSVTLENLCNITILNNHLVYDLNESLTSADAHFVIELYNACDNRVSDNICVYLNDTLAVSVPVTLSARERKTICTENISLSDIKLWNVGKPNLYSLTSKSSTDDLTDKVGFRKIAVKDGEILINGNKYSPKGINRHNEHPDFGFAFPEALMGYDIDIIKDMGCDSVRGSHYPNPRPFVDMLDETGITFWSEIPIWGCGFSAEKLVDEDIVNRGLQMHREMIYYYYNHPSIIIWGLHNEIRSDLPEGYSISEKYYKYVKGLDNSRIVTYASARALTDISFEFCDIICINNYTGWYNGKISDWDKFISNLTERLDEIKQSEKPIIMSEFGAASVYGHTDFEQRLWSENYQAELIDYCLKLFDKNERIKGTYIWQLCDIRTAAEMGLNRARGYNNKGMLNEYRKPKLSYFVVQKNYKGIK